MIYMFRFAGGAIGVSAASALHSALFHRQLVFHDCPKPHCHLLQQEAFGAAGAPTEIGQIGQRPGRGPVEQVRRHFYESFEAAFTGTLR